MSEHPAQPAVESRERGQLGEGAWPLYSRAMIVGMIALVASLVLGYFARDDFSRFYFSYLVAWSFCLSIALGAIFFVLIQHLTRAGWSVSVRRMAGSIAATMPVLPALAAPILVAVILNRGALYRSARPNRAP